MFRLWSVSPNAQIKLLIQELEEENWEKKVTHSYEGAVPVSGLASNNFSAIYAHIFPSEI